MVDWGGSGPLALLSHANGFCAALWEPIALALRDRFHVVGFDARGHGDSSVPERFGWDEFFADLLALAERLSAELGVERVDYGIGHSFGGTVTLAAASQRPELFGRIALLDPVVIPQPETEVERKERHGGNFMEAIARKRRVVWESREAARTSWSAREPFKSWQPQTAKA